MEQARNITRFERDRASAAAPSFISDEASFVDALFALPGNVHADAVDRAMTERQQMVLARKLRAVIDGRPPDRLAG